MKNFDIIIVGSGMSGLYSAYKILEYSPNTSFIILEKYKKSWIGGRTSNDIFYDTEIVTGAGIGRKKKDKLLYKLIQNFDLKSNEFIVNQDRSKISNSVDIMSVMKRLKTEYNDSKHHKMTFKEFAKSIFDKDEYKKFTLSVGYTDFENEDVFETLYYYGMDDNLCCWKAFSVPWKKLVLKLYDHIGANHFKFSSKVIKITKILDKPCKFLIDIENGTQYTCNKVIIGSTISTIRKLLPYNIYNDIDGQPFLRLYAKFTKSSIPILMQNVKYTTLLPDPLQKIIPINPENGIYMIAYNDNDNTIYLKNHLQNNKDNRELYEMLLEKSLKIPKGSLHIIAIKDYYWPIGTHYYKPLNRELYDSREDFIHHAQNPEKGILVVGEAVSRNQGWTEGALESVKAVVTKKWINTKFYTFAHLKRQYFTCANYK